MNIFHVDSDPILAAQALVDKHICKMLLESGQILSTAHRILDGVEYTDRSSGRNIKRWRLPDERENILYSATHVNHPCSVWARQTLVNYNWLSIHFAALSDEYTYRYGKMHATMTKLGNLVNIPPNNIALQPKTIPPSAMPAEYVINVDPVINYRQYYIYGKSHLHRWTKRGIPNWI